MRGIPQRHGNPKLEVGSGGFRRRWVPTWLGLLPALLLSADPPGDSPNSDGPVTPSLPEPVSRTIEFSRDVLPILETSCLSCHGADRPRGGFRLTDRKAVLAGGYGGVDVLPGDSANSPLIHYVAGSVEDLRMPPPDRGEPLTLEQVAVLRAWIDQDVVWADEPTTPPTVLEIESVVQGVRVDGDEGRFRQDTWMNDGGSGGLQRLFWQEQPRPGSELTVEGRGILGQADYGVSLRLKERDWGFLRAGFDSYRKYFGDIGGFYEPWDAPAPSLDRDLHLDITRSWVQVGLDRPHLPRLALGYRHELKEGSRATLQWGQFSPDPLTVAAKAIAPNSRQVLDVSHRLTLDASYTVGGFLLEDNFLAQWAQAETRRQNQGSGSPDTAAYHREGYEEVQWANTFRVEKQLRRDWLLAGGYLYTRREGEGTFDQMFSSLSSAFPPITGDRSDGIVLEFESHVGNLNTQIQPWRPLSFWAGLQGETQRQQGFTPLLSPGFPNSAPAQYASDFDRYRLDQTAGSRFDGIPFTVLEFQARWQEEWTDHYERGLVDDGFDDSRDFLRDTDATGLLQDYQAGFTVSPWPSLAVGSGYRYRVHAHDYDHLWDADLSQPPFGSSGNGYPAFIRDRSVSSQEVDSRLVWRAASWLKATLKHQWIDSRYRSNTDPSSLSAFPTPVLYPGGELLSGQREEHSYSVNLTWTPRRRWYLSGTFGYTDATTLSGVTHNTAALTPYAGDIYTVLARGTYLLDASTDLTFSYHFSRADYRQDNASEGLPLGIRYDRHGLTTGVIRRWSERLSTRLQYGWFDYTEPTSGGANNYQAHALALSLNYALL